MVLPGHWFSPSPEDEKLRDENTRLRVSLGMIERGLETEIQELDVAFQKLTGRAYVYDTDCITLVLTTQDAKVARLGGALGILHKFLSFVKAQK